MGLSTGDASDPGARPTSSSVPVPTSTQPGLLPQPGFQSPVSVDRGGAARWAALTPGFPPSSCSEPSLHFLANTAGQLQDRITRQPQGPSELTEGLLPSILGKPTWMQDREEKPGLGISGRAGAAGSKHPRKGQLRQHNCIVSPSGGWKCMTKLLAGLVPPEAMKSIYSRLLPRPWGLWTILDVSWLVGASSCSPPSCSHSVLPE